MRKFSPYTCGLGRFFGFYLTTKMALGVIAFKAYLYGLAPHTNCDASIKSLIKTHSIPHFCHLPAFQECFFASV